MKNKTSVVEVEDEDHVDYSLEHRTGEGEGQIKQCEALLVTDLEIGDSRCTQDYRFGQHTNLSNENQIKISKLVRFFMEPVDLNIIGEDPGTLKFIASLEVSVPEPVLPYSKLERENYAKFGLTLALTLKDQNLSEEFKSTGRNLQIFTRSPYKIVTLQITSYDSAITGGDNCKRPSFEKPDLDAFPFQNSIQISLNFLNDQCWPVISKTTSSFTVTTGGTGAATSWMVSEDFLTSNQCSVLLDQCILTRKRSKQNHLNSYSFIIQSRLDFTIKIMQPVFPIIPIILNSETGIPIKRDLESVIPYCLSKLKHNRNLTSTLFDRISQADFSYPFSLIYYKEVRSHWEFLRDEVFMNLASSRQLEKGTRFQLNCSLWREKRMLLITTSKFDRFAYLKETEDAYLIHQEAQYTNIGFTSSDQDVPISGATSNSTATSDGQDSTHVPISDTNSESEDFDYEKEEACEHGRIYEKDAISLFLKIYENVITEHCEVGLCIQPKLPYLGTSPDYLVAIHGELHIVEVKCPYKLFRTGQSIMDRTRSDIGKFFLQHVDDEESEPGPENEQLSSSAITSRTEYIHCNKTSVVDNGSGNTRLNTKLRINPKNKVYFQMQGQLNLCNVERGILIVFVPPNDIQVVFVQRDTKFFYRLLRKLSRIWFTRILPKLASPTIATMEDEEEEI